MRVFFTASLRGTNEFKNYYKNIYRETENLGYVHLDKEIFALSSQKYYKSIENAGRKAFVDLYNRKMKHLKEADICIFECSLHSLSIGFLIQKALDFNKPTIVLFLKDHVPHFLAGIEDEKLIVHEYEEKTLNSVLRKCFDDAREKRDKRFNFFISPRLLTYLEKTSSALGITKSKFIRGLLIEHMKKFS
ncbi:hypothetical protein A2866_04850 [Candidatus Roizmanbacteria bacterium RIFCSPHIGHO2_01_FULL_39_8]|uniref:Ribbon-helix-helix protein CopG domain-containing protein n=1 Tax=Candidatus Roizmanbacteria bacterium RIFCSPHIGHO2_01_FULL_39_8 TaxID=1802033 RepID=A0A1F7GPA5_9BACT|nr:MAG: hypothetical protein A2866_04850 [Candidatus Roizmanbacteria bacterium RIFCSPHIGHO2_01_FULL_39_8]